MGMQTGTATMENSMEFPQKIKNGTAIDSLIQSISSGINDNFMGWYNFALKGMDGLDDTAKLL